MSSLWQTKYFFFDKLAKRAGHNWAGQFCTIMAWIQASDLLPRAMERTLGRRDTKPFHATAETRILMKWWHIFSLNDLQIYQISEKLSYSFRPFYCPPNTNMQRMCVGCGVLGCVYQHASERLNIPLPPIYSTCPFSWAAWTFRLISFWLHQLCKMILNGHLDNGRALLSLIAPDDDQWGSLDPRQKSYVSNSCTKVSHSFRFCAFHDV